MVAIAPSLVFLSAETCFWVRYQLSPYWKTSVRREMPWPQNDRNGVFTPLENSIYLSNNQLAGTIGHGWISPELYTVRSGH